MSEILDAAIIGGGPAGLTAGIYCARAGLNCAIIEMLDSGGQMAQIEHLENYPGFNHSRSGYELSGIMEAQAEEFGCRFIFDQVESIDFDSTPFAIRLSDGELQAKTVIIATGARPAKLGIEGEDRLIGSGISYCATCDGNFFKGKDVCVVGGGDTAVADAIYLSRICNSVTMLVRRDALRATQIYHAKLKEMDNVSIRWNTLVDGFTESDGLLTGVDVYDRLTGEKSHIDCAALFVAVGTVPNTEFLDGKIPIDHTGHIIANSVCATSVEGVYAVGDVRAKELHQITTAVADGANAAEDVARFLIQHQ